MGGCVFGFRCGAGGSGFPRERGEAEHELEFGFCPLGGCVLALAGRAGVPTKFFWLGETDRTERQDRETADRETAWEGPFGKETKQANCRQANCRRRSGVRGGGGRASPRQKNLGGSALEREPKTQPPKGQGNLRLGTLDFNLWNLEPGTLDFETEDFGL